MERPKSPEPKNLRQVLEEALTLQVLTLEGLQVVDSRNGYFLCNFVVPNHLSDGDGNWHVGAMATMIDTVGAAVANLAGGDIKASLDLSVSFYATAKIQEEVKIEAKVVGGKERLSSVLVEITRKGNGELVALGKQWMASKNITLNPKFTPNHFATSKL